MVVIMLLGIIIFIFLLWEVGILVFKFFLKNWKEEY